MLLELLFIALLDMLVLIVILFIYYQGFINRRAIRVP
jgi:hypothetical protein